MTYLRTNGRISGRVSGRWGRASVTGTYALGADEVNPGNTGIVPTIKGDATTALIAQVNRFQKASGQPEFPLATGTIPVGPASAAMRILFERLMVAAVKTPDAGTLAELDRVAKAQGDPVLYITPRVAEVTRQIALYGDSKGLPPAPIGITTVTNWHSMSTTQKAMLIGGVALAAAAFLGRRKR